MSDLTLGKRVLVVLGLALGLIVADTVIGGVASSALSDLVRSYSQRSVPALDALSQLAASVGSVTIEAAAVENGMLEADVHERALKDITAQLEVARAAMKALRALELEAEVARERNEAAPVFDSWAHDLELLATAATARAAAANRFAEAAAMQHDVSARFEDLRGDAQKLLGHVRSIVARTSASSQGLNSQASARMAWASWLLTLGFVAGALIMALAAALLVRSIRGTLGGLERESGKLLAAVRTGKLSVRAEPDTVSREFRPLVEGMNATLDAFAGPFQVASTSLERIAAGDVEARIEQRYEGDFDVLRSSVNSCVDTLSALIEDVGRVAEAANAGRLDTRADASRHRGEYRRIVEGINHTLDAITAPITAATEALERLAQRDLRARVVGAFAGDYARIKDAVNGTGQALHDALARVAESAEQVTTASSEIASSSHAVAEGASRQASALEEAAASLATISATTHRAAAAAEATSGVAQTASSAATDGAAAMQQMSSAMAGIRAAAASTAQIIRDINEIAFQTNLLALNAAVEAARAGDAGRGFAVVAEEVRALALRSKEAAHKTESLIQESMSQADAGEASSRRVAGKLGEIVGAIGEVTRLVAEVAGASRQQAQEIEQVDRSVRDVEKITQQAAATAEEFSSAATELSGQSDQLKDMVSTFELETSSGARALTRGGR